MTWFDRHPADLAEQSEPSEALAALRPLDTLDERQLVVLDVCLSQWVPLVFLRPDDREGILEVQQLCELAQDLAPDTAEGRELRIRWKAFGDLLEGKRYALQNRAIGAPVKLLHEDAILCRLSRGPCKQSDLVAELELSRGRVSQMLGVLETQGKIARERKGKESWVSLPAGAVPAPRQGSPRHEGAGAVFFSHAD